MRGGGGVAGGEDGGGGGSGDLVTLGTVLECRGTPLTEEEIWALLAAAATTVQDALLSGKEQRLHGICYSNYFGTKSFRHQTTWTSVLFGAKPFGSS